MKQKIAFAVIMGLINTGIISLVLVSLNIGFTKGFLLAWLSSWIIAFVIVIPGILFFSPIVQAFVERRFAK